MSSAAIIGTGLISNELINQLKIIKQNSLCSIKNIKLIGIIDTKDMITVKGADDCLLMKITTSLKNYLKEEQESSKSDLDKFLSNLKSHINSTQQVTLVDCTASAEIAARYVEFLEKGFNVVAANKIGMSSQMELYEKIVETSTRMNKKCLFESSVLAGLPVIKTIKEIIKTGDTITNIEGILSGSLSYIFNNLNNGGSFYDVLIKAKNNGYTEPDFRLDLSGLDVARKIIIISRLIGLKLEMNDLEIENIIPEKIKNEKRLMKLNIIQFEEELKSCFANNKSHIISSNNGTVPRYVGAIDVVNNKVFVGVKHYQQNHLFANLQNNDNVIVIKTTRYSTTGISIVGAGAGSKETVHGILCDLLDIHQ